MTIRMRRTLTVTAVISTMLMAGVFTAVWYMPERDVPVWLMDLRWMLMSITFVQIHMVILGHAIMSSQEAFRLGVLVGERSSETGDMMDIPTLMGGGSTSHTDQKK